MSRVILPISVAIILVSQSLVVPAPDEASENMLQDIYLDIEPADGAVKLLLGNKLDKDVVLFTNVLHLMDDPFYGVPTSLQMQLFDREKNKIVIRGEAKDGWWQPSLASSDLTLGERTGAASEVVLAAKSKKEMLIKLHDVIKFSRSFLTQTVEPKYIQIRMSVLISTVPAEINSKRIVQSPVMAIIQDE